MSTYSTLQTRVQRRVIDLPSTVTAEIPALINEAIRDIQGQHNFRIMEAESGPTTTTTSRTLLAAPSDWKAPRGNPYLRFNDGTTRFMKFVTDRWSVEREFGTDTTRDIGEPEFILEAEPSDDDGTRNFEVWPLSDSGSDYSDGEYRILIPYWKYIPDLSADGDSNWFTVNATRYVVEEATAQAFFLDFDEERGALWLEKAAKERRLVIQAEKKRKLGAIDTFVPHRRGVYDSMMRT